jgi:beta-lactamase superfamily II metal-dependent hydrolase
VLAGHRRRPVLKAVAGAAFVSGLLLPAVAGPSPTVDRDAVARGIVLWRDAASGGAVAQVSGAATQPDEVLDGLRERGVHRVDVVVVSSTARSAATAVAALRSRLEVGTVWQPADGRIPDADVPQVGDRLLVGGITVEARTVAPQLLVDVRLPPGPV